MQHSVYRRMGHIWTFDLFILLCYHTRTWMQGSMRNTLLAFAQADCGKEGNNTRLIKNDSFLEYCSWVITTGKRPCNTVVC